MIGKLIVIDGADGSGKATQSALLYERLEREGKSVEKLDFPQYTENFFGALLRECLDGKCGDFMEIHPKIVSTLYAADRFESSVQIKEWLEAGSIVILDRYVSANMLHQGAKIEDEKELEAFLAWLDEMEHGVFKIPRPDIILFLDVPHAVRKNLLLQDATRTSADLAEQFDAHQIATEQCAKKVGALCNNWQVITCVEDGQLRSKEDIHEDVYALIQSLV